MKTMKFICLLLISVYNFAHTEQAAINKKRNEINAPKWRVLGKTTVYPYSSETAGENDSMLPFILMDDQGGLHEDGLHQGGLHEKRQGGLMDVRRKPKTLPMDQQDTNSKFNEKPYTIPMDQSEDYGLGPVAIEELVKGKDYGQWPGKPYTIPMDQADFVPIAMEEFFDDYRRQSGLQDDRTRKPYTIPMDYGSSYDSRRKPYTIPMDQGGLQDTREFPVTRYLYIPKRWQEKGSGVKRRLFSSKRSGLGGVRKQHRVYQIVDE